MAEVTEQEVCLPSGQAKVASTSRDIAFAACWMVAAKADLTTGILTRGGASSVVEAASPAQGLIVVLLCALRAGVSRPVSVC